MVIFTSGLRLIWFYLKIVVNFKSKFQNRNRFQGAYSGILDRALGPSKIFLVTKNKRSAEKCRSLT